MNVENPHSKGLWNSRSTLDFFLTNFPINKTNIEIMQENIIINNII